MNIKIFSTDSFQLASYLLCESCRLISVNKNDPHRVVFNFEETNKRVSVTENFLGYKALIEPHRYFSAQKDLKQLIYQKDSLSTKTGE
jgi:hypothetical protein